MCSNCAYNLNRYNPACLECGGRYLRAIQARPMGKDEKLAWLRKALADWMAMGHDEQRLRELAKPGVKR